MQKPRAHIVLKHPGEGEQEPEETQALRRAGKEFLKNCIIPNKEVDGKKLNAGVYDKWKGVDVDANRTYGLAAQEHLFKLLDYDQLNGGFIPRLTQMRGSCMFHALRKGMKCPREFKNSSEKVLFMIETSRCSGPFFTYVC